LGGQQLRERLGRFWSCNPSSRSRPQSYIRRRSATQQAVSIPSIVEAA
jgi:hypothetical protein